MLHSSVARRRENICFQTLFLFSYLAGMLYGFTSVIRQTTIGTNFLADSLINGTHSHVLRWFDAFLLYGAGGGGVATGFVFQTNHPFACLS